MRSLMLGLVTLPVMVFSCAVVFAADTLVLGSSMGRLKDQVAVMAEKTKRVQEEAKSSMNLLKLRLAAKLAVSEETLARQVEILSNYEEQLRDTTGTNGSDPQQVRLESLVRQVRSDVASELDELTDLLTRLKELREKIATEADDGTAPGITTGPSGPSSPPPQITTTTVDTEPDSPTPQTGGS